MAECRDATMTCDIWSIVPGCNGDPCIRNELGQILITNNKEICKFVDCTPEIVAQFNCISENICIPSSSEGTSSQGTKRKRRFNNAVVKKSRAVWTHELVTQLIELVKSHQPLFESSTVTDSAAWQKIANLQQVYSSDQIKNKWRDLKDNYYDYVWALNQTGAAPPPEWPYYEAMHDMLKDDPRTKPVALASSSKGSKNLDAIHNTSKYFHDESSDDECTYEKSAKSPDSEDNNAKKNSANKLPKSKKTRLDFHLEQFEQKTKERELNTQRRHDESMEVTKKLVGHFSDFTDTLKLLIHQKVNNNNDKSKSN